MSVLFESVLFNWLCVVTLWSKLSFVGVMSSWSVASLIISFIGKMLFMHESHVHESGQYFLQNYKFAFVIEGMQFLWYHLVQLEQCMASIRTLLLQWPHGYFGFHDLYFLILISIPLFLKLSWSFFLLQCVLKIIYLVFSVLTVSLFALKYSLNS